TRCFFPIQMNVEKLMKMAGAVRTGGKGSMRRFIVKILVNVQCLSIIERCIRHTQMPYIAGSILIRKKKAVHKTTTTDDKRLQSTLKRIGVNTIPAIEEVNIFKDDSVIQFANPKVKSTNTCSLVTELQDLLPGIINQLGNLITTTLTSFFGRLMFLQFGHYVLLPPQPVRR
ncbi:hypothetical protein BHE74_00019615, partial [Ensete ventricosum]